MSSLCPPMKGCSEAAHVVQDDEAGRGVPAASWSSNLAARYPLEEVIHEELKPLYSELEEIKEQMAALGTILKLQQSIAQQLEPLCSHINSATMPMKRNPETNSSHEFEPLLMHPVASLSTGPAGIEATHSFRKLTPGDDTESHPKQPRPVSKAKWHKLAQEELDHACALQKQSAKGYDPVPFYSERGFFAAIAKSKVFARVTSCVLSLNWLSTGLEVDREFAHIHSLRMLRALFALFFSGEILVRFLAYRIKRDCLKDRWFKFDALLVGFLLLDEVIHSVMTVVPGPAEKYIRLLKLLYLARIFRVLNEFPRLRVVFRGVAVAAKSVFYCMILLGFATYLFAIVLTMYMDKTDAMHWGSLPQSMRTLIVTGVFFDELADVIRHMVEFDLFISIALIFMFILAVPVIIMNVVIGVIVDGTMSVSRQEEEYCASKQIRDSFISQLQQFDDGDGQITKHELEKVLQDSLSGDTLRALDVNLLYMTQLKDMLFEGESSATIPIECAVELMIMCRGSASVTVQHIAQGYAFLDRARGLPFENNPGNGISSLEVSSLSPRDEHVMNVVNRIFECI